MNQPGHGIVKNKKQKMERIDRYEYYARNQCFLFFLFLDQNFLNHEISFFFLIKISKTYSLKDTILFGIEISMYNDMKANPLFPLFFFGFFKGKIMNRYKNKRLYFIFFSKDNENDTPFPPFPTPFLGINFSSFISCLLSFFVHSFLPPVSLLYSYTIFINPSLSFCFFFCTYLFSHSFVSFSFLHSFLHTFLNFSFFISILFQNLNKPLLNIKFWHPGMICAFLLLFL